MVKQLTPPQLITVPGNLTELSTSLKSIAPADNETAQLITYALIATAVVGIFIYQYIKAQEKEGVYSEFS